MIKKVLIVLIIGVFLTSCYQQASEEENLNDDIMLVENNNLMGTSFENLDIPDNYDIRQFQGMTLNFIVENNLYASILSHESEEFYNVTGINVKIKAMDFDTLVQKVNLDFISKAGNYQLVYVDPYQTLNRFYEYLEVLNGYNSDSSMPKIKGYTDDFFEKELI